MDLAGISARAKQIVLPHWRRALGKPPLHPSKIRAIDLYWEAFHPQTFADLGGVWVVDGAYAFHALAKPGTTGGYLVDTNSTDGVIQQQAKRPALTLVNGEFGDPKIVSSLGHLDVVFFFDTLLHQVKPNWDEVLRMYAPITKGFIIFNQQWTSGPDTIRLLDLGEERYMKAVPSHFGDPYQDLFKRLDEMHPQYQRPWRDVHNIWQWGITDRDLMRVMDGLQFKLQLFQNCGRFAGLADFENHLFIYTQPDAVGVLG